MLRYLAFNLLIALASSAANERVFLIASYTLNEERFSIKDDFVEGR